MIYRPVVKDAQIVKSSKSGDAYEVAVTLQDSAKCKLFVVMVNGEMKPSSINRLQNVPCPICRKDYYCNCMERCMDEVFEQASGMIKVPS
ncbi:hypothetical protein [Paenibacillus sp. MBLB4367]|uniref:hypothetical protein n=1 Tax=Paenibacillus sp. MBLB4367 TaxID=3384767 RepID=UPI0039083E1C